MERVLDMTVYSRDITDYLQKPKSFIFDDAEWARIKGDRPKKNNFMVIPLKNGSTKKFLVKEVVGNLVYLYLPEAIETWEEVCNHLKDDGRKWDNYLDGFSDALVYKEHSWYSYVRIYNEPIDIPENQKILYKHISSSSAYYFVKCGDGPSIKSRLYLETIEEYSNDQTKTLTNNDNLRWLGLVDYYSKRPIYQDDWKHCDWHTAEPNGNTRYRGVFYIILDVSKYNKWKVLPNTNWESIQPKEK